MTVIENMLSITVDVVFYILRLVSSFLILTPVSMFWVIGIATGFEPTAMKDMFLSINIDSSNVIVMFIGIYVLFYGIYNAFLARSTNYVSSERVFHVMKKPVSNLESSNGKV